jgi:hypothetical protein
MSARHVPGPTGVRALAEEMTMGGTRHGQHLYPEVRLRAEPATGERGTDDLRNGIERLDHQPGTCRPSCSPECYRTKVRSLAFTLPAGFRAAR